MMQDNDDQDAIDPAIPPLTGHALLEQVHRSETGTGFEQVGDGEANSFPADIPLSPAYLSADEISVLMQSDAYRSWHHPTSEQVRQTVGRWFELTYPGPLKTDASGRTIRTADRDRPESAPKHLAALGPVSLQQAQRFTPQSASPALSNHRRRFVEGVRRAQRRS